MWHYLCDLFSHTSNQMMQSFLESSRWWENSAWKPVCCSEARLALSSQTTQQILLGEDVVVFNIPGYHCKAVGPIGKKTGPNIETDQVLGSSMPIDDSIHLRPKAFPMVFPRWLYKMTVCSRVMVAFEATSWSSWNSQLVRGWAYEWAPWLGPRVSWLYPQSQSASADFGKLTECVRSSWSS